MLLAGHAAKNTTFSNTVISFLFLIELLKFTLGTIKSTLSIPTPPPKEKKVELKPLLIYVITAPTHIDMVVGYVLNTNLNPQCQASMILKQIFF